MKKSCLGLLLLAFVCSCAATTPVKRDPVIAPPALKEEFKSAEKFANKGDAKRAIPRLKRFVEQNPETDITGDAYFRMGELYENTHQYKEALESYLSILNMPVKSPHEFEAGVRAARLQIKLGDIEGAERTINRLSRLPNLSLEQEIRIEELRLDVAVSQKQYLRAIDSLVRLAEKHPDPVERERYKIRALDSIDPNLSEDDLREIADNRRYSFLRPEAKFRYGVILADQKRYSKARDYLFEAAQMAPDTELAERANKLIAQIDSRHRVDPRTIGVVLPLSGKQSAIGYKALRGIQLGLGVFGNPSGFRLAVIDSEGNPDVARRAVERLVQEDNAIALIGGLLGKTASVEAAKAQEFGVPMILLTQKSGATHAGDYIFRNALTSQMQVQKIVETVMGKMGMRRFAIMFPNDAYGIEFANLFWDEVRSRGGVINGAQPYDPKETDFRSHVQRLVGTYYIDDRADEYKLLAKAWREKNPKRSARQSGPTPEELLPPIIDFDAIFIPDSARAVGQIAPMLAYNNVSGVRLIGTNIWNSPALITRGQKFVEDSIFVDSFLANDPEFLNSEFRTKFKETFEEEPGLTEIQSYDSALILRQILATGVSSRNGVRDRLARLRDFPGALGYLSVNSDREFLRPLTVMTVKNGQITRFESIRQ